MKPIMLKWSNYIYFFNFIDPRLRIPVLVSKEVAEALRYIVKRLSRIVSVGDIVNYRNIKELQASFGRLEGISIQGHEMGKAWRQMHPLPLKTLGRAIVWSPWWVMLGIRRKSSKRKMLTRLNSIVVESPAININPWGAEVENEGCKEALWSQKHHLFSAPPSGYKAGTGNPAYSVKVDSWPESVNLWLWTGHLISF